MAHVRQSVLAAALQVRHAALQGVQTSGLVEARNWLDAQLVVQVLAPWVVPAGHAAKHCAL